MFWLTFQINLYVPTFFATSGKKVLDPNLPYIRTSQTKIRNVCLSIILEFCLFLSVCSLSTAYTSLCSGLKYLLKYCILSIIIMVWLNFSFSGLFVWADRKHWPMSEKISQKLTAFVFGYTYLLQTFTECVSNQNAHFNISTCQM